MKVRRKKYREISPVEFLLFREAFGLKRYRKTMKRDEEERKILLEMGLRRIEEKEKGDFTPIGYRKRKVKVITQRIK